MSSKPQLFLDCDGVLADFDVLAEQIFGMSSQQAQDTLGKQRFWKTLRDQENFYGNLPLMADGRKLFDAVRHLEPVILTGCPLGGWAEAQKQGWAAEHFPGTKVITCMARDKSLHMKPGDVLVDDNPRYRELWEKAGGIFIHHTSAENTIRELQRLGLVPRELT